MASKAETFRTYSKFGKIGKRLCLSDHEHEKSELIDMTKNCEKSQLTRKVVRLAIFRNTRKIAIFAAGCKPGHKCLRPKKDGSFRIILNLKDLNTFFRFHHFKVESIHSCYMTSIELRDA